MTLSECSTSDTDAAAQLLFAESAKSHTRSEESSTIRTNLVPERTCLKCESSSGVASFCDECDASDAWSLEHLGQSDVMIPSSRMHKARSSAKRAERQRLISEGVVNALTLLNMAHKIRLVPMTDQPYESIDRYWSCDRAFKISL
eukprot:TRINITY_DN15594_c0_g1_i1.p1 TRINITY_DN15594_c0_g1~~TRINITY_DN15594_c0_g1_i1.p1  ORF type:complete len:145 (+),score=11.89 TRINITY_DN15594_c0_g1_i1:71-505(+)